MELQDIKMAVLGDSITEGTGVVHRENLYYNRVKDACGMRAVYADGIAGTRFACQKMPSAVPSHDLDFISRVDAIDVDCDLIVVFGGTNDFGHGDAPLGSPKDDAPYTFWGACNLLCEKLLMRFPKSQIVFMGPLHRLDEDHACGESKAKEVATLYEYCDIIQQATKRYSLPYLDLMQVSGMTPKVALLRETYMPDGLHPNDEGHALIAKKLIGFLRIL